MTQIDDHHQIDELREILNGANSSELAALKERIESVESRTKDVAEVLAPAIRKSDNEALVSSLKDPVSSSLKFAIRSEPEDYAEILYPVMAPAIRRAISQAISSLMVTINKTVESATSVSGIRTRIQSFRTGIPYAELALRQSLLYRVEHVYLIDRESGMQIAEVASQQAEGLDGDAVSAMFSAIQSFVQDSFSRDRSAMLTDLKVGDHNVWVAHGPSFMLACVIQGNAPEALKGDLYDALYKIRTDYANEIASFDGNLERFEGVENHMQPLLQLRLKEAADVKLGDDSGTSNKSRWPLIVAALIVLGLFYVWFAQNSKIGTVEYYLRQTPGIAATDVYWSNDRLVVEGLKDPDAKIPFGTFEAYGIQREEFDFRTIPFRSLEVDMELQRFRNELTLPAGVYLSVRDDKIYLYGEAPITWLTQNDSRVRQLAADGRLTISALSASFESVSDVLRANFSEADLRSIRMSSAARADATIVQIGGSLSAKNLAFVSALFAGNRWVSVIAKRTEVSLENSLRSEKVDDSLRSENVDDSLRSEKVDDSLKLENVDDSSL